MNQNRNQCIELNVHGFAQYEKVVENTLRKLEQPPNQANRQKEQQEQQEEVKQPPPLSKPMSQQQMVHEAAQ